VVKPPGRTLRDDETPGRVAGVAVLVEVSQRARRRTRGMRSSSSS
jgi:hypothetical protein